MSRSTHIARRTEAGFTLIEALVAMVVLSFGLISITNLLLVAASSNTVANQSTGAATIASEEMERLKGLAFTDPLLAGGGDLDTNVPADCSTAVAYYCRVTDVPGVGQIRVRWKIVDISGSSPNTPPAGLKFITIRAEGLGALTGARSRAEFTTFRTENPTP